VLAESGAIVEYINSKYGDGRLALAPAHPHFAQFLFWFHFANGTLQAAMLNSMVLATLKLADDHPRSAHARDRLRRSRSCYPSNRTGQHLL
jgi:glutathione S-transferase